MRTRSRARPRAADQIDDFDAEHPDIVHHLKYIATLFPPIAQLRGLLAQNESITGRLGSAARRAGTLVAGFSASAVNFVRNPRVPDNLRQDYSEACRAYAGYRMLFTTASALREGATCRMAAEFLSDYSRITLLLQDLLPDAVVTQLEADGLRLEEPAIRRWNANRIEQVAVQADDSSSDPGRSPSVGATAWRRQWSQLEDRIASLHAMADDGTAAVLAPRRCGLDGNSKLSKMWSRPAMVTMKDR
jgi:hypothetical protein